jgi:serine/threonine protein kinase/Tol biopolymer transport system component
MNADRWARLSALHNAWLAADPAERQRIRERAISEQPDLLRESDELVEATDFLRGFLETPAFMLEAYELAVERQPLSGGATIGPYQIVSLLARGGMGDVYRATDLRLRRDVALKLLARGTARDGSRTERFLQEARVTASLDHPNIINIYDVGVFEGRPYLVAELLDGETVRARLERGPIEPAEARRIAIDVARGLTAAHAAGLVHRDMKPDNVFLTRSRGVKILDFGIAKLGQNAALGEGLVTTAGVLIGTAAYVSPEQVQGESVDARSDLFALGALIFEMLTGARPFARGTAIDSLHAIVHDPPSDALDGRNDVQAAIKSVVMRLLEKQPDDRFQSAADLAWALEHSDQMPAQGHATARRSPKIVVSRRAASATIAIVVTIAAAAIAGWAVRPTPSRSEAAAAVQLTWNLPAGISLASAPVVSPNGRFVAFAGSNGTTRRLFVRDMELLEAEPIAATEGAMYPFWSPDSASIGFFARGKLLKVAVRAGAPVELANAPVPRGGSWSASGTIVFQPHYRDAGLEKLPAAGGPVEPATVLDASLGDVSHRWPAFLPDGVHFLYHLTGIDDSRRGVYIGRIDTPASRAATPLFTSETGAVYENGMLLSAVNDRIEARPFDPVRRVIVGDAQAISLPAAASTLNQPALIHASSDVLAFARSTIPHGNFLASISRGGENLRIGGERDPGGWPRVSPDGRYLASTRVDPLRDNPDIWVTDLERNTDTRVTTSPDFDVFPVWSPDGRHVAHRSGLTRQPMIRISAADGTGVIKTLQCPKSFCEPTAWNHDGLIVNVAGGDVWIVPVDGSTPRPILAEPYLERDARISPDGRWITHVFIDESQRAEVAVRSLTDPPRRTVISSGGGDQPSWSQKGDELFYVAGGRLHSVSVRTEPDGRLTFSKAVPLQVPNLGERHWGTVYEVSRDGNQVYFPHPGTERAPQQIGMVLRWTALLAR